MNRLAILIWSMFRPWSIKVLCWKYPPRVYRLKNTRQIGEIVSYFENGTVKMYFPMEPNLHHQAEDREVFGIDPADLEVVL